MGEGRLVVNIVKNKVKPYGKWYVFIDGVCVTYLTDENEKVINLSKGKHIVQLKMGICSTRKIEVTVENEVVVKCTYDGSLNNFYVEGENYNYIVRETKKKTNTPVYWIIGILVCLVLTLVTILMFNIDKILHNEESKKVEAESTFHNEEKEKITFGLNDIVERYCEYIVKNIKNDDATEYEKVLNAFILKEEYFRKYERNIYAATYEQNGRELFSVEYVMGDNNEVAQIKLYAYVWTNENGFDGASEILKILSYGHIYAVNPNLSHKEVVEIYEYTLSADGKRKTDYEYTDVGDVLKFDIIISEEELTESSTTEVVTEEKTTQEETTQEEITEEQTTEEVIIYEEDYYEEDYYEEDYYEEEQYENEEGYYIQDLN